MSSFNRILIIKLSAIGDVIHALPVAHGLKQCFPQAHITWIVERPAYDLLTNNPNVDDIILFDKPKFKTLGGLVSNLPAFYRLIQEKQFDLVIDLQGLFKSAAIALITGAPKRVGYCNMRELSWLVSEPVTGRNSTGHVVDRYLDVLEGIGCKSDQADFSIRTTAAEEKKARHTAEEAGLKLDNPFIVLAPGTNWPTKCWPADKYSQLAKQMNAAGFTAVLIGGSSEQQVNAAIAQGQADCVNLTGKTSLKELACILKRASVFVGGDTGPMHLAAALHTPTVALFGPTDPARNGPYGAENVIVTANVPCAKCWKRKCEKDACMGTIDVESVHQAALSIMNLKNNC